MKQGVILSAILVILICFTGCKSSDYKAAQEQLAAENYDAAIIAFTELGNYKDSPSLLSQAFSEKAEAVYLDGQLTEAISLLRKAATTEANTRADEILAEVDTAQDVYNAMQKIKHIRDNFNSLSVENFNENMDILMGAVDSFRHIDNLIAYPELEDYADQLVPYLSSIEEIYAIDSDMLNQYAKQQAGGEFFMFPFSVQLSLKQSEDIYQELMDNIISVEFPEKYEKVISVED